MKILNIHTAIAVTLTIPLAVFAANGTMKGDGSTESPFQIEDYEDLKAIGTGNYGYSSNYTMTADIDASASASENCVLKGCHGFVPIGKVFGGTWDSTFSGKFDGKGHTISNLHMWWPKEESTGFFAGIETGSVENLNFDHANIVGNDETIGVLAGSISGGNVTNVHITNSTVHGYRFIGGIVGQSDRVTVCPQGGYDCELYDEIDIYTVFDNVSFQGNIYGEAYVGGIVGHSYATRIINSHADVVLFGETSIGGLVGTLDHTMIKNSYSKGTATPTDSTAKFFGGIVGNLGSGIVSRCFSMMDIRESSGGLLVSNGAGGIVGINTEGTVEESFSMGSIKGKNSVGGLVGDNDQYIRNSFSIGSVQGDSLVGGLVGLNGSLCALGTAHNCNAGYTRIGHVDSSYAIGIVQGRKYVGGLVGVNWSGFADILGCYWNSETSGLATSIEGSPLTTEEMLTLSSFVNWGNIGYDEYEVCKVDKCEYWNEATECVCPTGNYIKPWKIEEGKSFPYLAFNPYSFKIVPPLAVPTSGAKKSQEPKVASRLQVEGELIGIWLDWVSANDAKDSLYYGYRIGTILEGDTIWGSSSYMAVPNKIEISTLAELQKIGTDNAYPLMGNYELTADIDASSVKFKPIGDSVNVFSGVFNAKGHVIENLEIDAPNDNYVGLFAGVFHATIKDLTLKNAKVSGSMNVGALAGKLDSSVVNNVVSINGNVSGVSYVGGLMGRTIAAQLNVVAATGNVKGNESVGGLAGASTSAIVDAFSVNVVKGYKNVGGVVGGSTSRWFNNSGKSLRNVYSASLLKSPAAYGISAPNTRADYETLNDCYFDNTVAGNAKDSENGFSTSKMLKQSTYDGFDFDSVWTIEEGTSYPYFKGMDPVLPGTLEDDGSVNMLAGLGTEEYPYEISSYEELKYVGKYEYATDLYYELTDNIDASASAKENCDASGNCKGFEPIGKFSGVFTGRKHSITNLHISRADEDSVGIFRALASGAKVTGIILDSMTVKGKNYVGALAGADKGGALDSIYVNAEIYAKNYAGGIVGNKTSGSMTRSSSKGYIDGANYIGGLAGSLDNVTVTDCYSVTFVSGVENVGSMTGLAKNANVTNSYSAGGAYGTSNWGGLVGEDSSSSYTNVYYVGSAWGLQTDVGKNIFNNVMRKWSYDGLDFKNTWGCDMDWSLPYHLWYADTLNLNSYADTTMLRMSGSGTDEDPFIVKTYGDLKSIGYAKYKLSAVYKLTSDIDASESKKDWETGYVNGFMPIGDNLLPIKEHSFGLVTLRDPSGSFTGKLLGGGHKIKNLYMHSVGGPSPEKRALIPVIDSSARVESLTLENVDFDGVGAVLTGKNNGVIKGVTVEGTVANTRDRISGIAYENNGTIKKTKVKGTFIGTGYGMVMFNKGNIQDSRAEITMNDSSSYIYNDIGGLVFDNTGTISSCTTKVDIDVHGNVGALVLNNFGTVTNSYASGKVAAEETFYASGFVNENSGLIEGSVSNVSVQSGSGFVSQNMGTIKRSFAAGDVSGRAAFAGSNYATIEDCYSVGDVHADDLSHSYAGGFVAYNEDTAKVTGYALGVLIYKGKKICSALPKNTKSTDGFYYLADGCSDTLNAGNPLSQAAMLKKSSFKKFDFKSVWSIKEGVSSPLLRGLPNIPFAGSDSLDYSEGGLNAKKVRNSLIDMAYVADSAAKLIVKLGPASESLLDSLEKVGKKASGDFEVSYRIGRLLDGDTIWSRVAKTTLVLGETAKVTPTDSSKVNPKDSSKVAPKDSSKVAPKDTTKKNSIIAEVPHGRFNAKLVGGYISLRFDLLTSGEVRYHLLDMQGRTIRTVDFGYLAAGSHFKTATVEAIPRGRYIGLLQVNGRVTEKVFFLNR